MTSKCHLSRQPASLGALAPAGSHQVPALRRSGPNPAHALDAAVNFSLHIGRHWRGASDVDRYLQANEGVTHGGGLTLPHRTNMRLPGGIVRPQTPPQKWQKLTRAEGLRRTRR